MAKPVKGCSNSNCNEGEVSSYWIDHKSMRVKLDFDYCIFCYPEASGGNDDLAFHEVDRPEYEEAVKQGYFEC